MQEVLEIETPSIQLTEFKTFKERGEWVELLFMAAAASHGYHVLKSWGDSLEYDVAVEHAGGMLRVQVKSSSARNGTGYLCQFRRNYAAEEPYTLDDLDLFAMYVVPEKTWYLIPATVILTPPRKVAVTLCPVTARRKDRYRYEHYREAWHLLTNTPQELSNYKRWDPIANAQTPLSRSRPGRPRKCERLRELPTPSSRRRHPERSRISGEVKDPACSVVIPEEK